MQLTAKGESAHPRNVLFGTGGGGGGGSGGVVFVGVFVVFVVFVVLFDGGGFGGGAGGRSGGRGGRGRGAAFDISNHQFMVQNFRQPLFGGGKVPEHCSNRKQRREYKHSTIQSNDQPYNQMIQMHARI